MAIETLGGREYYTKAIKTSIDDTFVDVPAGCKAIFFAVTDTYTLRFTTGAESIDLAIEPAGQQVVNIIPTQIAVHDSNSRDIYFLY